MLGIAVYISDKIFKIENGKKDGRYKGSFEEDKSVRRHATRLSWHYHTDNGEVPRRDGHRGIHKEAMKANIRISYTIIGVANLNVCCFLKFIYA